MTYHLTKLQAQAIINAMWSLNDIGAGLDVMIPMPGNKSYRVWESLDGNIYVVDEGGITLETHSCQREFALAYKVFQ